MLRLANTRLPHALTSVKGRRRCPDLALLRRRALGVCRERRALRLDPHRADSYAGHPMAGHTHAWAHRSASRPQIAAPLQLRSICI